MSGGVSIDSFPALVRLCRRADPSDDSNGSLTAIAEEIGFLLAGLKAKDPKLNVPGPIAGSDPFRSSLSCWHNGHTVLQADLYGIRSFESHPIVDQNSYLDPLLWHPFEDRLIRSFRTLGKIRPEFSNALAGALGEMVDNVIQHSGPGPDRSARATACYFASQSRLGFGVLDHGRGALASLRENPAWSALQTSEQAVTAILRDHATRRYGYQTGDGYRALFKAVLGRNYRITIWTGTALAIVTPRGVSAERMMLNCAELQGYAIVFTTN